LGRCQHIGWSDREAQAKPLACQLAGYKRHAMGMLPQRLVPFRTGVRGSTWRHLGIAQVRARE